MQSRTLKSLPCYSDAPLKLLRIDGNCGLLSAWVALRHFGRRITCDELIKQCAYTQEFGVFAIGIAYALAGAGLKVVFHTDADPDVQPLERRLYARARRLKVVVLPAATVPALLASSPRGDLPIVSYDTKDRVGHFSPLVGVVGGKLLLPHDVRGGMRLNEFQRAWTAPGICRQAIVVGRLEKKPEI